MAKRMLVDATHPEETRVVVVNGNKLEELDFEIASRKQLKGNIYLAKVIRVEPSLQAAFVEYGGNRHGFLAFSEIHPDYYRIPVADREALLREQEEMEREREERERAEDEAAQAALDGTPLNTIAYADERGHDGYGDHAAHSGDNRSGLESDTAAVALLANQPAPVAGLDESGDLSGVDGQDLGHNPLIEQPEEPTDETAGESAGESVAMAHADLVATLSEPLPEDGGDDEAGEEDGAAAEGEETDASARSDDGRGRRRGRRGRRGRERGERGGTENGEAVAQAAPEEVEARPRPRSLRSYKIQEVIRRRQILLVQVTKEERGTKGAALTTYLSLPGRYCVLMPNTPRGGGISRKITNPQDRKRLKELLDELDIPKGMAVILRTAGMERSKQEIKRDLEYLMRLWDNIREQTMQSVAPALIYEEANLIKRSIRDLYSSDIDDVQVEGDAGFRTAKDFMRMLMPSHAKKIVAYKEEIPLFHRYQVEAQIDAMYTPIVQLRSGGYIVINQTEALVAIDVNSGRATKERNIEETALRTNLEAADEVARQLRLRDLAGLIVIDFIDMEDARNNAAVERRVKEAMKTDRARIQLGRISPFGLMELSRQRLRPSLQEINFERCPHCEGTGMVRSLESAALAVLRAIEEEGIRRRATEITVTASGPVALYILNQKRDALATIERRYGLRVYMASDDTLHSADHRLERIRARTAADDAPIAAVSAERIYAETDRDLESEPDTVEEDAVEAVASESTPAQQGESDEQRSRRRRRRRRRGGEERDGDTAFHDGETSDDEAAPPVDGASESADEEGESPSSIDAPGTGDDSEDETRKKRRRGKRGGRRRGRQAGDDGVSDGPAAAQDLELSEQASDESPVQTDEVSAPVVAVPESQETVSDVVVEATVDVASAPIDAAPKKRATRSRKKVVEATVDPVAEVAQADVAPTDAVAAPVETPAAQSEGEETEAKPKKRATRSRKKAVEPVAEIAAEPAPVADDAAQTVPVEPPAQVVEPAPVELPEEPAASSAAPTGGKPRKGWWSRSA